MRITVEYEDGQVDKLEVKRIVISTVEPVTIAGNTRYDIVIMDAESD